MVYSYAARVRTAMRYYIVAPALRSVCFPLCVFSFFFLLSFWFGHRFISLLLHMIAIRSAHMFGRDAISTVTIATNTIFTVEFTQKTCTQRTEKSKQNKINWLVNRKKPLNDVEWPRRTHYGHYVFSYQMCPCEWMWFQFLFSSALCVWASVELLELNCLKFLKITAPMSGMREENTFFHP